MAAKNLEPKNINMRIHNESDLYSEMDPDHKMLSEDAVSYLERVFLGKYRSVDDRYVITVISDTPVNEERVKKNIQEEFTLRLDNTRYELKVLMIKALVLLVFGVITLSTWLYFSTKTDAVTTEILSIIGWVFVWEATDIFIFVLQQADSRTDMHCLKRLLESEIRFKLSNDKPSD